MNMYVEIAISGYMLLMLFFFVYLNKRIRKKQVSDSYLGVLTELYKKPAVKFSHELVDSIGFRINYLFYQILFLSVLVYHELYLIAAVAFIFATVLCYQARLLVNATNLNEISDS